MMLDFTKFGSVPELIIQLSAVVILAAIIGFVIARWFYRSEKSSRSEILQQEIMRLRRRVADGDREANSLRRLNDRTKRQSKRVADLEGLGV